MKHSEILKWNKVLKKPFSSLTFHEEGHWYEIKGSENKPIKSVSTLLKYFYEDFNTDIIAPKYAKSKGFEIEDVKNAWTGEGDIANAHGTKVHLFGEEYIKWKYFKSVKRPIVFDKQSLSCLQFINDLPDYLIPVATELQMYSPNHWVCGTADLVLLNTNTKRFHIFDWKTNKTLTDPDYKKPYLKLLDKKYNLRQDNLGKYNLQLNFYRNYLVEAGFTMGQSVIIHLQENKETKKLYTTHKVINLESEVENWLNLKNYL